MHREPVTLRTGHGEAVALRVRETERDATRERDGREENEGLGDTDAEGQFDSDGERDTDTDAEPLLDARAEPLTEGDTDRLEVSLIEEDGDRDCDERKLRDTEFDTE